MILLRFARTFRERAPEWVMAGMQGGYGYTLLRPGDTFAQPFFASLRAVGTGTAWGLGMLLMGMMRIAALYVNGSMRETPRIRQIGCGTGMFCWLSLLFAALSASYNNPDVYVFAGLFMLEAIMFSYAAADASRVASEIHSHGHR